LAQGSFPEGPIWRRAVPP